VTALNLLRLLVGQLAADLAREKPAARADATVDAPNRRW